MTAPQLETKRLILRHWKSEDLRPFAALNRNPITMEFFPSPLSQKESDTFAEEIQKELREKDYGLWAVEIKGGPPFIGFIGLHYQNFPAHFTPCIEIGWRLAKEYWGQGLAIEGARKVVQYAFETLGLKEIVSFTSAQNKRSIRLMQKLGMHSNPEEDFEKSNQNQVLYRVSSE